MIKREFKPYLMNRYLPFTTKTKMAEVIHLDYRLIPIIGRFGIEYGFGNKTVAEVCIENNINVWFFLEIINSYHNHEYFPGKQLQNFDVHLIIDYLSNTHKYYLNSKIPEIQGYIDEMERKVPQVHIEKIKLLNGFFKGYKTELNEHLLNEDKLVFPYVLALEQALETKKIPDELLYKIKNEPIEKYERNHNNIEIKLSDLKNLIMKFLPPVLCKGLCQQLLTELFRLESDLNNHTRIEDKVLVPKVKLIEKKLLEYCGTK
jgi:regulator of cell morphogenesis and NO signaling